MGTRDPYESFIGELKERWVNSKGFKPPIQGCTVAQINRIMVYQSVEYLPKLYRQFMLEFGQEAGGLPSTGEFRYPYVLDFKKDDQPPLWYLGDPLILPSDSFIFMTDYDAYALFFQTTDRVDDPFLYRIEENVDHSVDEEGRDLFLKVVRDVRLSAFLVDWVEESIENAECETRRL